MNFRFNNNQYNNKLYNNNLYNNSLYNNKFIINLNKDKKLNQKIIMMIMKICQIKKLI